MAPVRREPIAAERSPLRPSAKENSRFRIVRRYSLLWRAHVRSRAAQRRHHEHRDAGAEKISRHESPKPGEQDDGPHGGDGE